METCRSASEVIENLNEISVICWFIGRTCRIHGQCYERNFIANVSQDTEKYGHLAKVPKNMNTTDFIIDILLDLVLSGFIVLDNLIFIGIDAWKSGSQRLSFII